MAMVRGTGWCEPPGCRIIDSPVTATMTKKEIALDLAAFLDSDEARRLEVRREDLRRIAEAFLTVCYGELGKAPRLFDGEDVRAAVGDALPGHFGKRDPLAQQVPAVLDAYFDHLEATQVVTQAFEIRLGLGLALDTFLAAVEAGAAAHASVKPDRPVRHRAEKLGRNDPCFCGSGKKFKKCHGKGA